MGNKNSHAQKSQKQPVTGEFSYRQEESDEDDDTETDNIQLEVETYECLNEESEDQVINLTGNSCKNPHEKYTPVEDLFGNTDKNVLLQVLPEAIRHDSVLEFIKIHEKLVVRIRASARGKTGTKRQFGTGCVYLSSDKLMRNGNCRIRDCSYNNGQVHENYGGLIVYTNKHVIKNHLEAGCCNVDFFYYNEKSLIDTDEMTGVGSFLLQNGAENISATGVDNSEQQDVGSLRLDRSDHFINCNGLLKGITAYGVSLREDQKDKDLVGLRIFYHDPQLFDLIKTLSDLRMKAWSKIPEEIKREMRKYAIIISHPHGWPKKISFGNLISLEQPSKSQNTKEKKKNTKDKSQNTEEKSQNTEEKSQNTEEKSRNTKDKSQNTEEKSQNTKEKSQNTKEKSQNTEEKSQNTEEKHRNTEEKSQNSKLKSQNTKENSPNTKETIYNATTCKGSSGAPVVTGHYSYRPFVHSSKNSVTEYGISYSY